MDLYPEGPSPNLLAVLFPRITYTTAEKDVQDFGVREWRYYKGDKWDMPCGART